MVQQAILYASNKALEVYRIHTKIILRPCLRLDWPVPGSVRIHVEAFECRTHDQTSENV